MTTELIIPIPAEVKAALRIPERELVARLRLELAVHLHEEWLLTFGRAVEMAQVSRWHFAQELAMRKIPRHYTEEDLDDDLAFSGLAGGASGR